MLATIAVVSLGAVAFLLMRGGPDLEIRLEPVAQAIPDAFTPDVSAPESALPDGLVVPAATAAALPPPPQPAAAPVEDVEHPPAPQPAVGSLPGLYGGTRDRSSCDPEALVAFLESEPDKAEAWAGVFDLRPDDIRGFVAGLTPVVLTRDTRVTNHGFANGRATRIQSVLQAGTAVLVDARGVPRVKCSCGNPLLPPAIVDADTEVGYTGAAWNGWDPANVVEVIVDIRVDTLVVIDLGGGAPFERPVGTTGDADRPLGTDELCTLVPDHPDCLPIPTDEDPTQALEPEPELGTGDVQATLRWTSDADLDLAVTDPFGDTVYFGQRSVPSGGELDYDVIPCMDPDRARVENVFWPEGRAPAGTYTVRVTYFSGCTDDGPQTFSLQVRVDGQVQIDTSGTLSMSGDSQEWQIEVAGG